MSSDGHQAAQPGLLEGVRVLDLADERGQLCGRILADLGADVVIVEPPRGSRARFLPPRYEGEPGRGTSLLWLAGNAGKRSVTLDVHDHRSSHVFEALVRRSDVVVTTMTAAELERAGLSYDALSRIKPDVILTTITDFGPDGPYAPYQGPDLVLQALSGFLNLSGDPDRAPTRISVPMAHSKASAEAAAATVTALYHRAVQGEGQQVDVSAQAAAVWQLMNATAYPKLHSVDLTRSGIYSTSLGVVKLRGIYPCRDGYVFYMILGGAVGAGSSSALTQWMDEDGMAPEWMRAFDWSSLDMAALAGGDPETTKMIPDMEAALERFFKTKTKQELFDRAYRDGMLLAPVYDISDIVEHPQLQARQFFHDVTHDELGRDLRYPGHLALLSEGFAGVRGRAPLLGEHNHEVYVQELGLATSQLQGIS